jgi:hypothetical protein
MPRWDWLGSRDDELMEVWAAIEAIGVALAFMIGAIQLGIELRRRARDRRRAQAEALSAWIAAEGETAVICLQNSSNDPVYAVVVNLATFQGAGPAEGQLVLGNSAFLSVVPPGRSFTTFDGSYGAMGFRATVEMVFTDRRGTTWLRTGRGRLTELAADGPEDYYDVPPPLPWDVPSLTWPLVD